MKMICSRTPKKLKSRRGETIAEVLVSLLISAVALVMLASMITVSTNMISKNETRMDTYYRANNELTTNTDSADGAVAAAHEGNVGYYPSEGEDAFRSVQVKYRAHSLGEEQIVAYWKK